MRYPIQRQLLWPMLAVVLLGSATTALLAATLGIITARQAEAQRLQQLAVTLTDAGFPLTDAVLKRMSDLSGAEFATLDEHDQVPHQSRALTRADVEQLATLPVASSYEAGSDRKVQLSFGSYRAIRIPVRSSATARKVSLVILTSQQRWNDLAWQAAAPPILAGLLAVLCAAVVALLLSLKLVERIRLLSGRAALLADGRFQQEPPPPVDDELRDLAVALNTTAEKLTHYESQIRQGERLKTLGQLGAGVAHQLRNGITGARMALDLHAVELPAEYDRESLTVALRQLELMESYLQRFLTIGRGDAPALQALDFSTLTTDALQLVEPLCRHHGIQVDWRPPATPVFLRGDADSLRQMLLNLLMNAIEAVQPLPPTERKIGVDLLSVDNDVVRLSVWDQGPGPDNRISQNLFDRFVTNKPDGTGLGLAVAQEIANSHEGAIRWDRINGKTVFEVTLAAPSSAP